MARCRPNGARSTAMGMKYCQRLQNLGSNLQHEFPANEWSLGGTLNPAKQQELDLSGCPDREGINNASETAM